jgi:hypothetical protein
MMVVASLVVGLLVGLAPLAEANTPEINIHHGRMWHSIGYDGADGWDAYIIYPGGMVLRPNHHEYLLTRQWADQTRKGGTWFMSTGFQDPNGVTHPNACSYMFRSMDYNYPFVYNGNFNYVWPLGMIRDIRWDRPTVTTNDTLTIDFAGPDGLATPNASYPSYGNDPRPPFTVKADLVTEMASEVQFRYVQGVKIARRVYSYPQGSQHQDYVIEDITLTNDGIHGDPDALPGTKSRIADTTGIPAIPAQTINKALWFQATDIQTHAGSGVGGVGPDQDGYFSKVWPGVDNYAWLSWDEDDPTAEGPDYGDPVSEDWENIMVGNAFVMRGPLFVSAGTGAEYNTNLTGQPGLRTTYYERGFDLAGQDYSPADMDAQRSFSSGGMLQQVDGQSYKDNALTAAVRDHGSGPTFINGYGPISGDITAPNAGNHGWDIGAGESVRIVAVVATGGVHTDVGRAIGVKWNAAKAAAAPANTWMSQADIDMYMTGEDTVRKAVNLAYWNYHGEFASGVTAADLTKWGIADYVSPKPAAYNQPFNVPDAPAPPASIDVTAPSTGGILIKWAAHADGADYDTKAWDLAGYRVYRMGGSRNGPWEVIADGWIGDFVTTDGMVEYIDNPAIGVDYWYAVTAYDDGSQNWANPASSLESGFWWTYSGFMPGTGVQSLKKTTGVSASPAVPGLALLPNTPNPFNPSTVISYTLDRSYDNHSLRIYDVTGREVRTLVNNQTAAVGLHKITWDGLDNVGRDVASGVYLARMVTPNGTRSIRMLLAR